MKKLLFAMLLVVLLLLATTASGLAIVHPNTPSDDCSDGRGGGAQAFPHITAHTDVSLPLGPSGGAPVPDACQ